MRSWTSDVQTAMAASAIIKRRMILFELPSGNYGFWDGLAPITPSGINVDDGADGQVFKAGGSLIGIDVGAISTANSAPDITLQLRATVAAAEEESTDYLTIGGERVTIGGNYIALNDVGAITPDVLSTIFQEEYAGSIVSIYQAIFSTADLSLLQVSLRARGILKQVVYKYSPDIEGPGKVSLEATVEQSMIEWNRRGVPDRNHESQKKTYPGDKGLATLDKYSRLYKWGAGFMKSGS